MKNTRLSKHFLLGEFLRLDKYPDNIPTIYQFAAPGNHLEHPDMMFGLGTTNNTKIIAELFGHFRYFLYLCSIIKGDDRSACSCVPMVASEQARAQTPVAP